MKLLFAIIQNDDTKPLTHALIDAGISVTRISSTGGFLSGGNTTLMIGVQDERLNDALEEIRAHSSRRQVTTIPSVGVPHSIDCAAMPVSVSVGGATVFILNVDQAVKF
ncbi:MAG: cyclic-di-AMP receptor [Clostridia bacterium]|nr:cyclic-di-AMP receptor [Clostridia bacterium]